MAGVGKPLVMRPRVVAAPRRGAPVITDRPHRINLANYEQRLRKLRNVVALILGEIDDGLEQIVTNRQGGSRDQD